MPWTIENPVISLQMVEEQPIGTVLTTLQAYDEESTIGEFNITKNPYFVVNPMNGVITLTARLDYETVKEVKFMATVTDTGIPALTASTDIVVDVININDNGPTFNQIEYNFNVTENALVGTVVGHIDAFDKDLGTFGEITYHLIGEKSKYFLVDSFTGIITVANNSILDREMIQQISLTAVAKDKAPATLQRLATVGVSICYQTSKLQYESKFSTKVLIF